MAVRNMLVIQFPVLENDSFEDFLAIEAFFFQGFSQSKVGIVDGYDYGQGKFNVFIFPRGAWAPVIERAFVYLRHKRWLEKATIAKRTKSEKWQVIWPADFQGEFEL